MSNLTMAWPAGRPEPVRAEHDAAPKHGRVRRARVVRQLPAAADASIAPLAPCTDSSHECTHERTPPLPVYTHVLNGSWTHGPPTRPPTPRLANRGEWFAFWWVASDAQGVLTKDRIRGQYDGSVWVSGHPWGGRARIAPQAA